MAKPKAAAAKPPAAEDAAPKPAAPQKGPKPIEHVLNALRGAHRTPEAIATVTGLDEVTIQDALSRLVQAGCAVLHEGVFWSTEKPWEG